MGMDSMPEMVPHYEFWAGIPSLVKVRCYFLTSVINKQTQSNRYHQFFSAVDLDVISQTECHRQAKSFFPLVIVSLNP